MISFAAETRFGRAAIKERRFRDPKASLGKDGGARRAREACRTEAAQKVGDGGRAQRSTEGRAGAEPRAAKALCPASESCLAGGRCRIVEESSLMGALVIVESSTGERGEPLLWRGRHAGSTAIRKRLGREPGQTGGGNRGKSGDDGSAFKAALRSLCV